MSDFQPTAHIGDTLKPFPPLPRTLDFEELVYTLELYIVAAVDTPYTEDQLKEATLASLIIRPLVNSLVYPKNASGIHTDLEEQHRGLVSALLVARADFLSEDEEDVVYGYKERSLNEARAITAEQIASRFINMVKSDIDRIEFLTYEYRSESGNHSPSSTASETTPLLAPIHDFHREQVERKCCIDNSFKEHSALELAVLYEAKDFLSAGPVEIILNRIWKGHIVFWNGLNASSRRSAQIYTRAARNRTDNMFARLRVPRYRSFFIMTNYAILLGLFYALLFKQQKVHRANKDTSVTWVEIFLHVWFAGFVLDEVAQVRAAGSFKNYLSDYWNIFDFTMIGIYLSFCGIRYHGYYEEEYKITQFAYDVLSLEALLLVPRMFSFLAIYPYFGTLLPCLKQLAKEFMKFITLVVIVYIGFFTTFTFLGRSNFTMSEMYWLLINVFFGSPNQGFDRASDISPVFGPWLMLVFVTLTKMVLITVLVSTMSQRMTAMMKKAREGYVYLFASTVLESTSTGDKLTYFYPPLNLITLAIRPMRLVLGHDRYRKFKIAVLKQTHWPFAFSIWVFEQFEAAHIDRKHRAYLKKRGGTFKHSATI